MLKSKTKNISRESGFGLIGILVIILTVAVAFDVGFLAYKNLVKKPATAATVQSSSSPKPSASPTPTPSVSTISTADWKTYSSTTGGGLTLKYPANWHINVSTKPIALPKGGYDSVIFLDSQKPVLNAANQPMNQYVEVQLTESWSTPSYTTGPFPTDGVIDSEDFTIGSATVSLVTSNTTLELYSKVPESKESAYHIALNNEHYLSARAYYASTRPTDLNLSDPEVQQAKLILKSVQLVSP